MISQYLPPGETAIPPTTLPSQTSIIPPPLPPPHSPSLASPPSPSSLQAPIPPPPPLPPPSPASGAAPPHVFGLEKSHLLKEALEKAGPVPRSKEDVKRLLKLHKDRCQQVAPWHPEYLKLKASVEKAPFSLKQFQKRLAVDPLLCRPALAHPRRPSVRSLNRNPSLRLAVHPHSCLRCALCGLVALWMAGTLLAPPSGIPLERLMQMAVERGYSAQGEMFSVADMGRLAQEALGCQAEHLCGGLGGLNRDRALQHLVAGYPLLIPYDEDFNHEPCQKKGHKAHWAVSTGVLLGVQEVPSPGYAEDPELPGLFHPVPSTSCQPPSLPDEGSPGAVYLLSKQGKSWHYQLWDYNQVRDSNLQLMDFSPSRAADGREYVVPAGGVRAGLCGQALLLRPRDSSD